MPLSNTTIFDESLTGMLQLDATGHILAANDAAAALAARPSHQLEGSSITTLFEGQERTALVDAASTVCAHGVPIRRQALLIRSDGTTRLTALSLSRHLMDTEEAGKPVVLMSLHDITAGSSALLRQVHDQKLEELGRLASGIAHEIRSPLQYVTTSIRFARSAVSKLLDAEPGQADPELRSELDESMTEVAEGIARISQIVTGMNILSQREGGVVRDQDVRDALKFPLAVARGQAPAGTDFVVELGDVPLVACNIGLLQQVVLNLLVNAIHAIEDRQSGEPRLGGKLTVSTRYDPSHVSISVADNGCGMDDAIVARAMEPFFTTKPSGRGSGQGLALVRDIMAQHNGGVSIESSPGEGTTITVSLPRTDVG